MPLLGSEEAGLGSVRTAAGGDSGGSPTPPAGTGVTILGKFSALSGDVAIPTTTYMDDAVSVGGGSAVPLQYPTSARTITVLRLVAPVGTGANPPTATLMKNGVATAMTCTLPGGAAAGAEVSDSAHSVAFVDGDRFDVRLTQAISAEGATPFSATLEGPAAGSNFPGFGGAPPAVAAASSAGTSGLAAQSDHTHAQSFGGTGLSVGTGGNGAATTAARGDHGHSTLTVPTSASFAALVVTAMVDGTRCYVISRDRTYKLITGAGLTVNTWDTFNSATAGRQWVVEVNTSTQFASKAAWFVDGSAGDDDAAGTASGTPLKTLKELALRLGNVEVRQNTTIACKNIGATDTATWTYRLPANILMTFQGVLDATNQIGAGTFGTVASFTVPGVGAGTGDVNFSDASIPVSFTASGLLASGVIFKRTNGTALYWFAAADKGAKTCRISRPVTAGASGALTALAVNDTYNAYTMPTIPVQRFTSQQGCRQTQYQFLNYTGAVAIAGQLTPQLYMNSWRASATGNMLGGRFAGCCIEISGTVSIVPRDNVSAQFSSGCIFRGTGADIASFFWHSSGVQAFTTFQGVTAQAFDGGYLSIEGDWYHNDCTGPCVDAEFGSIVQFSFGSTTACLIGSGNTGKLAQALYGSRIEMFNATPFVAGSTTDANPISVDGTAYTIAQLPRNLGPSASGIYFVGTAALPFLTGASVANGAVAVAITNVAPAGTAATIQRWVDIPDGAGGTFRVPSFL